MASQIDPSKPTSGHATTEDVRDNFTAAKAEIEALQGIIVQMDQDVVALQNDVLTLKARQQAAVSMTTANPPNTSSSEFALAVVGVTLPAFNGTRLVFRAAGQLGNTANGAQSELQLVFGVGSLPPPGTLVIDTAGELVGGVVRMMAAKPNDFAQFSAEALLEDLTEATEHWLGIGFRAVSGTATLSELSLVAVSLLDPIP